MSEHDPQSPVVLMVDDDDEDVYLTRRAFRSCGARCRFDHVNDGESLFAWLDNVGDYTDPERAPRPQLILMDINMPRENGLELLGRLRRSVRHSQIPVIMLSTSVADRDVDDAYRLGANSFIGKPTTASGMQEIARQVGEFWFGTATLP